MNNPQAKFEITADDKTAAAFSQVNTRLKGMESGFSSLANVAKLSLGFLSVGTVVSFSKAMFDAADAIGDAAAKFGTSAETLSRLKFAAEQNDVEFQSLAVGIKTAQKAIAEAANGSDEATKKFTQLGISASALRELSLEDQFKTLADAFKDIKSPADQTRIAMELFGEAGADLVPLLSQGGIGIDQLMRKADELGITLSNTTAAGIGAADAALKQFKATIAGFSTEFLGNILINSGLVELSAPIDILTLKLKNLENQRFQILHTDLLNESRKGLEAINTAIDTTTRKLTELQRLQAGGSAVASGPNSRSPRFNVRTGDELEAVGLTASSAAQSGADKVREINEQLAVDILEIQDRAIIESVNRQFEAITDFGAANRDIFAETDASFAKSRLAQESELQDSINRMLQIEQQAAAQRQQLQTQTFQVGLQALQEFGGSSKKALMASVLLNRGWAIAQVLQNVAVASSKSISLGPWGWGLVAANVAFGAAQIASINRASNLSGSGGSGSMSLGTSVNPVFTQPDSTTGDTQQGASQQNVTNIIVHGSIMSGAETAQWLIDTLKETISDRDVIIIDPNSRQAQELMPS